MKKSNFIPGDLVKKVYGNVKPDELGVTGVIVSIHPLGAAATFVEVCLPCGIRVWREQNIEKV